MSFLDQLKKKATKLETVVVEEKQLASHIENTYFWYNTPVDYATWEKIISNSQNVFDELFESCGTKLVLVDFFAYSCTNCIRTIPVLKKLYCQYKQYGLEILAYHRPEFEFERNPINIYQWIERESIDYPVGLDNEDAMWNNWNVEFWPQHFLIVKEDGKYKIAYQHFGDRGHSEMERMVQTILCKTSNLERATVDQYNHEDYHDVEIFLGKHHQAKNEKTGCGESACSVHKEPLYIDEPVPVPTSGKIFIYGTNWCFFCRQTKAILDKEEMDYTFINMDKLTGPSSVRNFLIKKKLLPHEHETIPIVFDEEGNFLGGYSELVQFLLERGDTTPSVVNSIKQQETGKFIRYQKEHSATIRLEGLWSTSDENIYPLDDDCTLVVSFNMKIDSDVYVYVVVENIVEESIEEQYLEIYDTLNVNYVNYITDQVVLFKNDWIVETKEGELDFPQQVFRDTQITVQLENGSEHVVDIPYPGRHFITCFENKGEQSSGEFVLRFQAESIKLYTIYITTEPNSTQ
eukprot:TRINITY_DN3625_c0_g5_i2.p1 TRINITY_DN3625_c0_g5~~TRINITY_DN3625_c0_g5_i2.p1  ORF type:complete len:518 (-),score=127.51 TRINITY_DN3625_c0_g5_i2:447-2000(-)